MNKISKKVEAILAPPPPHMVGDGFRVHNFFPNGYRMTKRMSPFYLLDYNSKIEFSPRETPRGVGVHPHRGFETVTIAYRGKIAHHDSAGNSGVIEEGDVQWMTAGSGVLHKEYHEREFSRRGGLFHVVQLWVNLPARYKMTPPKYQPIERKDMGRYELPNDGGVVEIIAGEYHGVKGPASTFTPINLYNGRLKGGTTIEFVFPEGHNTGILVVEGTIGVDENRAASTDHFILYTREGEAVSIATHDDSLVLVLDGEPIKEPIAAYGPFVMNTYEEIQQAFVDFQSGKFGALED
jgi:hypothetical protein